MDSMEFALVRDSISLYDHQHNKLAGPPVDIQSQVQKEIYVDGKLVGYLVMRNLVDIKDQRIQTFQKNFNSILILTGGLGLLGAFMASIFVAKQFLAPIKSLTRGTRALTEKRLETRIEVTSNDELGELAENFNQMAGQIEHMTQELTDLSLRDPLTSLRNRRYFDQFIAPEARSLVKERVYKNTIGEERRTADLKGLGLLVIDIDHFKQVNDGFGHAVGDRILQQFSEVISIGIRETDAAIRLGGEEFLIALKNIKFDFLSVYAEKIRGRVAEHPFEIDDQGNTIQLTCSIGFSRFPFSVKNPEFIDILDALSIADLTLYYAKENGRNLSVGVRPVGETIPECDKSILLTDIDYGIRRDVWRLELSPSS
jgi:diguanylate cyclase (GGDEF)-like protein